MFAFTTELPVASSVLVAVRNVVPAQQSPTLTSFRADDDPTEPPAGASPAFDETFPPKSVNA